MYNFKDKMDLPKTTFLLMFIFSMIVISFYILKPFIIGFLWSGMIVIATWSIFLKIQFFFKGNKSVSAFFMTFFLLIFFICPIFYLINSCIENCLPILKWFSAKHFQLPNLYILNNIPYIGQKLYINYQKILNTGGRSILHYIRPYFGSTTEFFITKLNYFTNFFLHLFLMLIFSFFLYLHGEKVSNMLRHFAFRLGSTSGDAVVLLAGRAIRSVALGVVITSLVQGVLSIIGLSISGIPFSSVLLVPIILFSLLQIGPLPILLPSVIWLYWMNYPIKGTILLIWSLIICILDNVLRTFLIRLGVDFPVLLLLAGIIGGVVSFGLIGLFIGPVVLVISYRLIVIWMNESPISRNKYKSITKNIIKKYHEY
ncbi:AI-2E family transporter YdiK [Buchnera aphidicola]|uniref:AI-2E family transporter YdiK n=1 Tax=Buchnera aphidicola TaxID=9 RepID=UPI0031B6DD52